MSLKKPSQLFESKNSSKEVLAPVRTTTPLMNNFNETFDRFKSNLDRVEELSEKINFISEDLNTKLSKDELESAIFSHLFVIEENFKELENQFQSINKKTLNQFKTDVIKLSEVVDDLIKKEIPSYKKKVTQTEVKISQHFNNLQKNVDSNLVIVEENLQERIENLSFNLDEKLSKFDIILRETKNDSLKIVETYRNLHKILESKVLNDDEKIEEYSQVLENFNQSFLKFEDSVSNQIEEYVNSFNLLVDKINESVENKLNDYNNVIDSLKIKVKENLLDIRKEVNVNISDIKKEVDINISDIKSDVVINEHRCKKLEKFLEENHQELLELKEEIFGEFEKLPYEDIQKNVRRLNKKIEYIEEVYRNVEPEVIVKEVIQEGLLNEPPSTKNKDSLTPLNQDFVTLDQLQQHYRLFLNRIQQQLSTLGGGGETRLKYLDDIVGITTNASTYDGKFLKYNHSIQKFEFESIPLSSLSNIDTSNLNNTSVDYLMIYDPSISGFKFVDPKTYFGINDDFNPAPNIDDYGFY